jgi:hypothetical protein
MIVVLHHMENGDALTTNENERGEVVAWAASSEEARDRILFVQDRCLFPASAFAALENPEAIRRALTAG